MTAGHAQVPGEHRPYPVPARRPWVMRQEWHDLLFAHWPVPVARMRALVPHQLPVDTWDGEAWIGIVPFAMTGVTIRGIPPVPRLSAFLELNVRTYVTIGGRPGVYFFSLDAASWPAVLGARLAYGLPYYHARMTARTERGTIRYTSRRDELPVRGAGPGPEFRGSYRTAGGVIPPRPGTLESWLTDRYCLYQVDARGQVHRGEIDHGPWPLASAEADIERNSMTAPLGLKLPRTPALLHYARYQDVRFWLLTSVPRR